jgi:hypothetical protein
MGVKHSFFLFVFTKTPNCACSAYRTSANFLRSTLTLGGSLITAYARRCSYPRIPNEIEVPFLNRSILRSQKRRCILRSHKVKRERTRCSRKPNVSPDLVSTYLFKLVFDSSLRSEIPVRSPSRGGDHGCLDSISSQKCSSVPWVSVCLVVTWSQTCLELLEPILNT